MSYGRESRGKIEPTSACRKSGSSSAYHQQQEQQHQQHREESVSPGRFLSTMTLSSLHSTKGFGFASLLHSLPFYSQKGNGDDVGNVQWSGIIAWFSSSRTVRRVVRKSEEMEVRVMWKSDNNGRSAQGLKRKFGSALYMEIQGSTESGRVLGEEKRKSEMMGVDLKSSFAFAFAFADCQVKGTPFLLQCSKDTVSAGPNAPAPAYLST